jgi:hypothetical protein
VGSRCSRVARQHRLGVRHGETGFGVLSEASFVKGCSVPIGEGSDGVGLCNVSGGWVGGYIDSGWAKTGLS